MWETVWEVHSQSLYSQANTKVTPQGNIKVITESNIKVIPQDNIKVTPQGNTKQLSGASMGPTANPETLQLPKICRIVGGNNLYSIKLPKASNISGALGTKTTRDQSSVKRDSVCNSCHVFLQKSEFACEKCQRFDL